MGIQGLLPLLKSIHEPCNLKAFAGQTIGVDAYGWLHRGTLACTIDLALGKDTKKFVDFAMNRVRMLKHFGVTPYIVFDGDYLPSKARTEVEREKRRVASRKLGLELYRMNKISQAHAELQKAVDVTPEMARQFIEELKINNVQYVVAPYEADAQLVFLEKRNLIQGILSEDSDMLVFGAQRLLTKLDQYGDCILFRRARFTACREINLAGWSDKEFRTMTIMSGCDYLASIDKMGLKTAYRLVRKYKTIEKILTMLAFDGKFRVPPEYLENFKKAELTFLHQRVFCPDSNKLIMANELKPQDYDAAMRLGIQVFVGNDVEPHIALGVARGDLHPMTKKPLGSARREHFKSISGSRISNSPRTPLSSSRRHNSLHSSDLKSNKSITSYLQPGRTPLAEISPNVWRSSPTVSDIMRNQGETMTDVLGSLGVPIGRNDVTPASSRTSTSRPRPTVSAQQQPTPTSLSAPRLRMPLSESQYLHTPNSICNQAKRQRLCEEPAESDSVAAEGSSGTTNIRSRFFASSAPDDSPSVVPKRGRRKTDREIVVWSDEPETLEVPKDSMICNFQDVKGPVMSVKADVMHSKETVKVNDIYMTARVEGSTTQVDRITSACDIGAVVYAEENNQNAMHVSDFEKHVDVDGKELGEHAAIRREKHEENVSEHDSNEIVAVLESPIASGPYGILCRGSEDSIIPDSEDDEEVEVDVDSHPLPKLDLAKFLFRC